MAKSRSQPVNLPSARLLMNPLSWASLIVGGKFTVSALLHFVFGVNFPSTSFGGLYLGVGWLIHGQVIFGILRCNISFRFQMMLVKMVIMRVKMKF